MKELQAFLEYKAYQLRRWSIIMSAAAKSGHPTSCLSAADLVAALFFHAMRFDPQNFNNPNNDRFILSKGHASALLYAVWNQLGNISDDELMTYRQYGSVLEGHPTRRCPYVQAATGSLGIGLSIGVGHALNAQMQHRNYYTYVLLGDAELAEGSVWEAAELASYYQLHTLIGIVDCNRLGQTGPTMQGTHAERYVQRFEAFGWNAYCIDGHNMEEIMGTFDKIRTQPSRQPTMIIARTKKGHGLAIEDKNGYHGKPLDQESSLTQLAQMFPRAAAYPGGYLPNPYKPTHEKYVSHQTLTPIPLPIYARGDLIPTRKAYGAALTALGARNEHIIALDGDVKNSTFSELFEHDHPQRFIECFVAEQNMVAMGVGLDQCGNIPFISTFGAFMTRAHDQIRMAAIGQATIKLVGSHAGVSIGQDGPSQMALEDIALMRSIPNSIVLYPCDAVSTVQLVAQMVTYRDGISYLRTTRGATPVIYDSTKQFSIGGCHILRQSSDDVACIIAAGITVFEALTAYEQLQQQGISISIIDAYSVKPLDVDTITHVARASRNFIVTVEDHYVQGGLGEAVASAVINHGISVTILAITQLPQSGDPATLKHVYGIDTAAIQRAILEILEC